tara:strand:+ start:665 stop:1012 length:348 start_codon:yes stop_codon:yes gene_type:complete
MEKYLYFAKSTSDAVALPVSLLRKMEIAGVKTANSDGNAGSTHDLLDLEFQDLRDNIGSFIAPILTVTNEKGREVKETISNAIRKGKDPLIVVADELNNEFIHPDITAVKNLAIG